MSLKDFRIFRFLVLPSRKLCGFEVETEVKPGVLRSILNATERHNGVVLYISSSTPYPGERFVITILEFVDMTNADVSADELAEEMRKIKGVTSVEIIRSPVEGFIADNIHKLRAYRDRAILMRQLGYRGLISGIRERYGSGGEAFLYHIGFEIGLEYGKTHLEIGQNIGLTDPIRIYESINTNLFTCAGFGIKEVVKIAANPPMAILRVYDSFECELGVGSGKPYSQFIRGMIAGALTTFFKKEMKATETKCIAKGDPYCEFTVETT